MLEEQSGERRMKLVVFGKQEMRETILPDEIQGKYALSRPGVGKPSS